MKEVLCVLFFVLVSVSYAKVTKPNTDNFLRCLRSRTSPEYPITEAIYTPDNSIFLTSYLSYAKNKRCSDPNNTNLIAIIAAKHESHVQATVVCAKSNGVQIRTRSGGHDLDGLSYVSSIPFVVLDMHNLRSITVDVRSKKAWLVSSKLPRELFLRAMPDIKLGAKPGDKTIAVKFYAQFLGSSEKLMKITNKNLPELGLKREDCYEMSWLNTTMFWMNYPVGAPTSILLDRPSAPPGQFYKGKSDYVRAEHSSSSCNTSSSSIEQKMKVVFVMFLAMLVSVSSQAVVQKPNIGNFLQCLRDRSDPKNPITKAIFTPQNSTFTSSYVSYTKNKRYSNPNDTNLIAIVEAKHESHVQTTVVCAKSNRVQIRIRSGGHDYEGLSYTSSLPFAVLDMNNLRSITIDVSGKKAWVQAGATLGELYTKISEARQGATDVLYKWQLVSSKLPRELFLRAMPQITKGANKTIAVKFIAQFLGSSKKLMEIINKNLPELGLKGEDCYEMSWLNTTTFWADYPVGTSTSVLLKRPSTPPGAFFKSKSDYVKKPIPKEEGKIYGSKYFVGNLNRLMNVKAKYDPDNFFRHEQSIPPLRAIHSTQNSSIIAEK
ncbi:hypothetical protein IGI04_001102 [Brassica rapa subsp. trilocularis]|uniref:FAD-binding PCMH-type domain-containing protein n=1 Tax=Brassica rapa subsp. trilocularis TaxID=1813537 RepID=A0ABQ7NRQ9_BRACM|nr:hypothetical protein IGI04_001102 [Brassica rapa subsp. trilocularis]